jgi:hypothetical protein
MEHRQRISVSGPKSQRKDPERHDLVHSDNNDSSVVSDPRISPKNIDKDKEKVNTAVIGEYLSGAVDSAVSDTETHGCVVKLKWMASY